MIASPHENTPAATRVLRAADVLNIPARCLVHAGCGDLLPVELPVLARRRLPGLVAAPILRCHTARIHTGPPAPSRSSRRPEGRARGWQAGLWVARLPSIFVLPPGYRPRDQPGNGPGSNRPQTSCVRPSRSSGRRRSWAETAPVRVKPGSRAGCGTCAGLARLPTIGRPPVATTPGRTEVSVPALMSPGPGMTRGSRARALAGSFLRLWKGSQRRVTAFSL